MVKWSFKAHCSSFPLFFSKAMLQSMNRSIEKKRQPLQATCTALMSEEINLANPNLMKGIEKEGLKDLEVGEPSNASRRAAYCHTLLLSGLPSSSFSYPRPCLKGPF